MPKKPIPTPPAPAAPNVLPATGRALWRDIVALFPVDHFDAANRELLTEFCLSVALVRECDQRIAVQPFGDDGRPNPAIKVRAEELKAVMNLAAKLRLPISSTMRSETKAARSDPKHALKKPWEM
jgi:phage terminase small subunit